MGPFGATSGARMAITNGPQLRRCASASVWASSSPNDAEGLLCSPAPQKAEEPMAPETPAALAAKTQELAVAPPAPAGIHTPAKRKSVLEAAAEIANAINQKRYKLSKKTAVVELPAGWVGIKKGEKEAAPAVAAPEKAAAKAGAGSKTPREKAYNTAWLKAKLAALAAGKSLEEAKAAGRAAGKLARDAIA